MSNKLSLDSLIEDFKRVGDILSPHQLNKNDDNILNTKLVEIDGYSILIKFNRIDHGPFLSENLKIKSEHSSFLPFHLVAKLGKKFLGKYELILIESFDDDDKKTYEWAITLDKDGRPIPVKMAVYYEDCSYDDLSYKYVFDSSGNY